MVFSERNARVQDVVLGVTRGILTCNVVLVGNDFDLVFGGTILKPDSTLTSPDKTGFFLRRLLETFEVDTLDRIRGSFCRVKYDSAGNVYSIGNIVTESWFTPMEEMKEFIVVENGVKEAERSENN